MVGMSEMFEISDQETEEPEEKEQNENQINILKIPALGRVAFIGTLYDENIDDFIAGLNGFGNISLKAKAIPDDTNTCADGEKIPSSTNISENDGEDEAEDNKDQEIDDSDTTIDPNLFVASQFEMHVVDKHESFDGALQLLAQAKGNGTNTRKKHSAPLTTQNLFAGIEGAAKYVENMDERSVSTKIRYSRIWETTSVDLSDYEWRDDTKELIDNNLLEHVGATHIVKKVIYGVQLDATKEEAVTDEENAKEVCASFNFNMSQNTEENSNCSSDYDPDDDHDEESIHADNRTSMDKVFFEKKQTRNDNFEVSCQGRCMPLKGYEKTSRLINKARLKVKKTETGIPLQYHLLPIFHPSENAKGKLQSLFSEDIYLLYRLNSFYKRIEFIEEILGEYGEYFSEDLEKHTIDQCQEEKQKFQLMKSKICRQIFQVSRRNSTFEIERELTEGIAPLSEQFDEIERKCHLLRYAAKIGIVYLGKSRPLHNFILENIDSRLAVYFLCDDTGRNCNSSVLDAIKWFHEVYWESGEIFVICETALNRHINYPDNIKRRFPPIFHIQNGITEEFL